MDTVKIFSERLNELIKERNMNANKLIKELGVPQSTAQAWFVGKNVPNYEYLIMIAKYFNCSIDYLLGLTDY